MIKLAITVVTSKSAFMTAIGSASYGDTIIIDSPSDLDFSGETTTDIPAGVIVRGYPIRPFQKIIVESPTGSTNPVFNLLEGSSIASLEIVGPHPSTDAAAILSAGIKVTGPNAYLSNLDLSGWSYYAIANYGVGTIIYNSYIHECQASGYGYGILATNNSMFKAYNSTFRRCRHGTTGSGGVGCSYGIYRCYFGYPATTNQAAVDMHGTEELSGHRWAGENLYVVDCIFDMANEGWPGNTSTYHSIDVSGSPRGRGIVSGCIHLGGRGPVVRYLGTGWKFFNNRFLSCRNQAQTYTFPAINYVNNNAVSAGTYYTEEP